ncbi:MAG: P-loop NTPase fold protein [Akkermansiaceae bacterium]
MNTASLTEALDSFLTNPLASVGVIKGEWGVGKTHFWKQYLLNAFKKRISLSKIPQKNYSYVSLFGVSTKEELKKRLIAGLSQLDTLNRDEGDSSILLKLKSLTQKAQKAAQKMRIPKVKGLDVSGLIAPALERYLLKNIIVCLDDIERMDQMSIRSLFGIIADLTQELGCKAIVIYNDGQLDDEPLKEFDKYREKVVDYEWRYNPSLRDNLERIWSEGVAPEISLPFEQLAVKNIRVMKKVRYWQEQFAQSLGGLEEKLIQIVDSRIAITTLVYHSFPQFKDFSELRAYHFKSLQTIWAQTSSNNLNIDGEKKDPLQEKIIKVVGPLYEEFDDLILRTLSEGYLHPDEVREFFLKKNDEISILKIEEQYQDLWHDVYNGFGISQEKFASAMKDFIEQHHPQLGLKKLSEVDRFLGNLNEDTAWLGNIIEEAIERFISGKPNRNAIRGLEGRIPPELYRKVIDRARAQPSDRSLSEIIISLGGESGWDSTDYMLIPQFKAEDFSRFLEGQPTPYLTTTLKDFFERFNESGADPITVERMNEFRGILKDLSGQSKLNAFRSRCILGETIE